MSCRLCRMLFVGAFGIATILGGLLSNIALPDGTESEHAMALIPCDGVIKLFDGESLGDCYTWLKDTKYDDPKKVFRVTNGMLHITGNGLGAITTRKSYWNYQLVLEYRWGDKTWNNRVDRARDSGLLIHGVGADGGYGGIWVPSIEVQIIEGGVGDLIMVTGVDQSGKPVPMSLTSEVGRARDGEVIWAPGGNRETFTHKNVRRINWFGRDPDWRDVIGFRGRQDPESPAGGWTKLNVICNDGRIQIFVNGKLVNEAFDVEPRAGKLQLQSEYAELFIRRWELWPLGRDGLR